MSDDPTATTRIGLQKPSRIQAELAQAGACFRASSSLGYAHIIRPADARKTSAYEWRSNHAMNEHNGLPVQGYRPQTTSAIDLVNANKVLEEQCLRVLDQLASTPATDKRWLAIGRTHIELAWMAVNRSIFQPSRAKLPGDAT
jgi:hypothetical protein